MGSAVNKEGTFPIVDRTQLSDDPGIIVDLLPKIFCVTWQKSRKIYQTICPYQKESPL